VANALHRDGRWPAGSIDDAFVVLEGGRSVKQRIKIVFRAGILALVLYGAAKAGQLEDGAAAAQRGDYAAAMRL
jgi:hypothetical protein